MDGYIVPKLSKPANMEYIYAYGVGYYYGRNVGDEEPGKNELYQKYYGRVPAMVDVGFDSGYSDGVNDYMLYDEGER